MSQKGTGGDEQEQKTIRLRTFEQQRSQSPGRYKPREPERKGCVKTTRKGKDHAMNPLGAVSPILDDLHN